MEDKWAYQLELERNKVENKFNNFLRFLTGTLESKRRRAKAVGASISDKPQLIGHDCALVYNPQSYAKHPKIMLYSPLFLEGASENLPHLVMMAVLANMISDKDSEFEALMTKKVAEYISLYENK